MRAALRNFAEMPVSPKALILGDMKELGSESLRLHQEILREVKNGRFDKVYLCGESFTQAAGGEFTTYPTTASLIEALRPHPPQGFHILLKGSRGMALEKVIDIL
jgi:UDP-N-acetylmuramoyl-tripeptide--D-alanyl-D-alanine ligase